MAKFKDFLFNKLAGKLLARLAVTVASALATGPAAIFMAKFGIIAQVSETELTAGLIASGHAAYEWYKNRSVKAAPGPLAVVHDLAELEKLAKDAGLIK